MAPTQGVAPQIEVLGLTQQMSIPILEFMSIRIVCPRVELLMVPGWAMTAYSGCSQWENDTHSRWQCLQTQLLGLTHQMSISIIRGFTIGIFRPRGALDGTRLGHDCKFKLLQMGNWHPLETVTPQIEVLGLTQQMSISILKGMAICIFCPRGSS